MYMCIYIYIYMYRERERESVLVISSGVARYAILRDRWVKHKVTNKP